MEPCNCCRQQPCRENWLLEVQTLHIRAFSGEKRIQALGRVIDADVCDACAAKQLAKIKNPAAGLRKTVGGYMVLAVLGAVLFLLVKDLPLRIPSAAAVILGVLGAGSSWRKTKQASAHLSGLSDGDALELARRQLLLATLPKKYSDNDLSYLPMTPALAEADPRTLAAKYELLLPIAKKAVNLAKERYSPKSSAEAEKAKADTPPQ